MTAPDFIVPPATGWWVKGNRVPFPLSGELELDGSAPFVRIGPKLFPTAAALALAGSVPVIRNAGKTVIPTASTLTLTGSAPTIRGGPNVRPSAAPLVLTGATPLVGPPQYDATGFGAGNVNSFTTSLNISWPHVVGIGNNRAVAVAFTSINSFQTTASQIRAVTYDGVPMIQLVTVDLSADTFMEVWGLLNPPTGSKNVSVTVSSGGNTGRQLVGCSVSYTGVSGAGATSTNTGTGTALTQSVSSAVGEKIFQVFGALATQSGYNQTGHYNQQVPANTADIMIGDADGTSSSVSFSSTASISGVWAAASVRILP